MPVGKYPRTKEHKRHASEANKGKHAHLTGRPVSEATKCKIGEANRIKRTGSTHSQATKDKMSEQRRTMHANRTPEQKTAIAAKISAAKQAKPHVYTPEQLMKMSKAAENYFANMSYEEKLERFETFAKAGKEATQKITANTTLERFVATFFQQVGVEYIQQYKIGAFTVDFYLPNSNTVVEVNGCYWHRCKKCGFNDDPENKRLSDKRRYGALMERGYRVRVIWEHDIKQNILTYLIDAINLT